MNKRHCTFVVAPGAQRFHPERDLCRVARRRGSHAGCRQTAESSRVVSTPNVESVEIDGGRICELTKVQSDWQEGQRDLAQSRVSNFNEALDEVRNLVQRDDESRSQGEDGQEACPAQCLQSQLSDAWAQMGNLQNNIRARPRELEQ